MDQVKNSYAWKEAIDLSLELIRICEAFSVGDQNVLLGHLKQAVVEIPASVAADIKYSRGANLEPVVKLATELDLVHRVYPAVDTGAAPEMAQKLLARMESVSFHEQMTSSQPVEKQSAVQKVDIKQAPVEPEVVEVEEVSDSEIEPDTVDEPVELLEPVTEPTEPPEAEPTAEVPVKTVATKAEPRLIQINTDNA